MLMLAVCGPEMMLWFTIIAARHKTMATVGTHQEQHCLEC